MMLRLGFVPVLCFVTSLSACSAGFLSKYAGGRDSREVQTTGAPGPASAPSSAQAPRKAGVAAASSKHAPARPSRPTVFAVDQGTFRFQLGFDRVWDATLDVLLRNYNLAIADRANGLITTEWDSYYLDGKVHRNKVSLRVKRLTGNLVELVIFNNVELLSKLPDGGITEIWLPTDKNKVEIGRIIQNLAIATGQPKPELPQEFVAGSAVEGDKSRL